MARNAKAKAPKRQPKPKNKGGRPPKIVCNDETLGKVKLIASAQHTQPEAAALLGVSLACFEGFLRSNKKAREVWDEGRESGKASLRRMQFKAAQGGNVTMQIWLGKQYLGQQDKQTIEQTGKDGGPIQVQQSIDLSNLTDDELAAYRVVAAAAARNRSGDRSPAVH